MSEFFREEQIQNRIFEPLNDRIRVAAVNTENEPVFTKSVLSISEILQFAISSGILAGENYDSVVYAVDETGLSVFEFSLGPIVQFQAIARLNSPTSFFVRKRFATYPLLKEDGFFLLQENGDKILIQGLIPE